MSSLQELKKPAESSFECPNCNKLNRLDSREDVVELKPYFKYIDHFHVKWDPFKGRVRAF